VNSIVCIKRVPDSETRVKIGPDGLRLDEAGVKFVLNPYDEFALEEALRRKETAGEGKVVALTVGSDASRETLRGALAMGADEAILLRTECESDGLAVARALAAEISGHEFDLLLFGKQAIDDDDMQVPAMVAELLELPCVTVVVGLEIEDGKAIARREIEGGHEVVEFTLPAVVSAQKGLNEPRYATLKGIMAAKRKPLEVKQIEIAEPRLKRIALELPPPRPPSRIVGEGADAVPELVRRLHEEAKVL